MSNHNLDDPPWKRAEQVTEALKLLRDTHGADAVISACELILREYSGKTTIYSGTAVNKYYVDDIVRRIEELRNHVVSTGSGHTIY